MFQTYRITLESGIDVGQGINVGPGKFGKSNKRRVFNKHGQFDNGILLPKLFWPTVSSSDREKFLKFEAEGQEFAKFEITRTI